jgi:[ribosomal protein S18]-alanine N-acetyltransferase
MRMDADCRIAGDEGAAANRFRHRFFRDAITKLHNCKIECFVAFTLRDAELDDLEILWGIDQKCFSEGIAYSQEEIRFFMRRRGSFTLVAVEGVARKIAGFIIAHAGAVGHIITIDVVASARRSGVGWQLLGAAEDRLRRAGKRTVSLETAVDNRGALSFYKRHGYKIVETIPGYYANGGDAFLLRKQLGEA